MSNQRGLSLIELMVAILISTLLILGVLELFINTSASDRANTALARVQESGRVAIEIIGGDARRAGFQGCISSATETAIGSGLTLPDDAVTTTSGSITFRYAVTADMPGANLNTQLPIENRACGTLQRLYVKTSTYANCTNGVNLCLNGQSILNNAQITNIWFAIPIGNNTTWKLNPSNAELAIARAVRIALIIADPSQNISRSFTGTYELRNRL